MEAAELDAELLREAERTEPALAGPMRVLSARRGASGRTLYSVSARRLVPVDEQDAALHGISIALPVACEVEVGPKGELSRVSLAGADAEAIHEARAFARNLITSGAVRGLSPQGGHVRRGPGTGRPTHEVRTDRAGRKVIERVGFDATGRSG